MDNMGILNWITPLISIVALILSFCSLLKMKNQRRPYLSISYDTQKKSLCLTNYGSVPATLNKVDFLDSLDKLKKTDELASFISRQEAGKPFEDLEGTVIGPSLAYPFLIDANADSIKESPYITATLEYAAANRFSLRRSPYVENFRINLHPKTGYATALYLQRNQQKNRSGN